MPTRWAALSLYPAQCMVRQPDSARRRDSIMPTTFDAHHIAISHEDTFLLVGFADQEFDTQVYLMLQRAYEFDEQDHALGMDTVYIERDDQSQSTYGGIERVTLTPRALSLTLSTETANALGSETDLCIAITPNATELRALHAGLHQLCAERVPLVIDVGVDRLLAT